VSAPETFDAKGRPVNVANQVFTSVDAGVGRSRVTVGVTEAYTDSLAESAFPVTVDPSVSVGPLGASWVYSYGADVVYGTPYASYSDGYARIGNPYLSPISAVRWRSVVNLDYAPWLWSSVTDASLMTTVASGSGAGPQALNTYWGERVRLSLLLGPTSAQRV
jgi:hypothetical protein